MKAECNQEEAGPEKTAVFSEPFGSKCAAVLWQLQCWQEVATRECLHPPFQQKIPILRALRCVSAHVRLPSSRYPACCKRVIYVYIRFHVHSRHGMSFSAMLTLTRSSFWVDSGFPSTRNVDMFLQFMQLSSHHCCCCCSTVSICTLATDPVFVNDTGGLRCSF